MSSFDPRLGSQALTSLFSYSDCLFALSSFRCSRTQIVSSLSLLLLSHPRAPALRRVGWSILPSLTAETDGIRFNAPVSRHLLNSNRAQCTP